MLDETTVARVRSRAAQLLPELVELRRHLHSQPEIGLDTVRTSAKIKEILGRTSLNIHRPYLGNDVVADLAGRGDRTVCLRADIDALPIEETTGLDYASRTAGAMHACGHDGHTAMLVGAALVLDQLRDELESGVRFVFQPGEERICAGKELVRRGAVDGCSSTYAIHGWPGLPEGVFSTREGALFAAGSHFEVAFCGRGGHGALPDKCLNPIPAAVEFADALVKLHEQLNPFDGTVVSVCSIQAGISATIIPNSAIVKGTARYTNPALGDTIEQTIRSVAQSAAQAKGLSIEMEYDRQYNLPVINSPHGFRLVRDIVCDVISDDMFVETPRPTMTMEDFAYYLHEREGAMVLLGLGEAHPELHSSTFDFNDDVLADGVVLLCLLALGG